MLSLALFSLLSATAFARALPQSSSSSSIPSSQIPLKDDSGNSLPGAPDQTIRYAAIGIGTQNYTCNGANTVVTSAGAMAHLYDISSQASSEDADTFASFIANQTLDAYNNWPTPSKALGGEIGQHYFDPDPSSPSGVPTFNFDGTFLRATSAATIPANNNGVPSIVWVKLDDFHSSSSAALSGGHAFRVETVGGPASNVQCGDSSTYQQKYAAGYFITAP